MKINSVSVRTVSLPLKHSFQTSSHRKTFLRHLIVKIVTEDGFVGWGEVASPSDPYYSSETVATTTTVLRDYLAPIARRTEWEDPSQLFAAMSKIRGHEFAKAGLDIAAWDAWAKCRGSSLATALGATRSKVEAGVSLGIEPTVDELIAEVQKHVDDGYRRVKLKIGFNWDVEPVRAVRAAFPDLTVHVDANGVYPDSDETTSVMKALDAFNLAMIEQPYEPRNLLANSRLQQRIGTPVCLDESIVAPQDVETMLALDAGRVVNIKVSRMGGLTPARRTHDIAYSAGVPVWCGGMHEFGVGRLANVALSALPGFEYPSDVSGSSKYYAEDIITPVVTATDGWVSVPERPGLGHDIDEATLAQYTELVEEL